MKFLAITLTCLVTGCATQDESRLHVRYDTQPQGALLEFPQDARDISPSTAVFYLSPEFLKGGCMKIETPKVKWVSGATIETGFTTACAANGLQQRVLISRPNVPGLALDQAQEVRAAQAAKQQRSTDTGGAALYLGNAFVEGVNRGNQQQPQPTYLPRPASTAPAPSYTCSTRRSGMFGDQLRTDCRPQ